MPHFGFKHSPQTLARLSAARRGVAKSPLHRDRISAALIAYYTRSSPANAKTRAWREHRRRYKRALRARRRASRVRS